MIVNRNLLSPGGNLIYPTGYAPGFDPTHVAAFSPYFSAVASGKCFVNLLTGAKGTNSGSPTGPVDGSIGSTTAYSWTINTQFAGMPQPSSNNFTIAAVFMLTATPTATNTIL